VKAEVLVWTATVIGMCDGSGVVANSGWGGNIVNRWTRPINRVAGCPAGRSDMVKNGLVVR
jgi:hypothetical protein